MKTIRINSLIMILVLSFVPFAHARIKEINNTRKFDVKMDETAFGVVLFYCSDNADKNARLMIRHLKRDLQYVVQAEGLYQNARVSLLAVDVARDDLDAVASSFRVDKYPTILLFRGGMPVKNKDGKIVALRGFASRQAIRAFIDKNMREDVLDFMKDKYERSQRAQMDRTHLYFSYGMTLPASVQYAYPYYYSPDPYYGYAAPGIGVELGF
jgi:hypothetical protein